MRKLILFLLLIAVPAHADIIFTQDWEDGNEPDDEDEGFYIASQACNTWSIDNVTTQARAGTHSIRAYFMEDEADCDGRIRAQIQIESTTDKAINGTTVFPFGVDRWFGFSVYFDEEIDRENQTVWNPHAHNWPGDCIGGSGSIFALHLTGPEWGDGVSTGTASVDNDDGDPASYAWRLEGSEGMNGADPGSISLGLWSADEDMGGWTDFVFHMNMDYDTAGEGGDGILDIWKKGKDDETWENIYTNETFSMDGAPWDESCGNLFPKIGVSSVGTNDHDYIMYLDSIRWGDEDSSFAEVAPTQDDESKPGANLLFQGGFMKWLMWLVILIFLSGCADSSTTGNVTEKDQKQDIVINNTGSNALAAIYFPIYYATDTDTTTSQDTKGTSTFSPKSALGYQGTGSLADDGAAQTLEDITNTIKRWQDNRKKDSDNPVTTNEGDTTTKQETDQDKSDDTDSTTAIVVEDNNKPPGEEADSPIKLSDVEWLHTDVSGWKETGKLKSVSTGSGTITLDYDKANVWPAVKVRDNMLNANPWIFVKKGNKWYAGTFEWFRPGQTTKKIASVADDHIKESELDGFKPKVGETYGFMVSGLARDENRNTEERTNIVMYQWK